MAPASVLAHFLEKALRLGAWTLPDASDAVDSAPNTLLADAATIDALIEAVFRETTSIGVRYFPVERRILKRDVREVRVSGEAVGIKVASLGGSEVNIQPEFADCLRVAGKKGIPVKRVLELALTEYLRKQKPRP
jgi:uncharacterized protein (DUF111 family)